MVKVCLAGFGKMGREVYAAAQTVKGIEIVSILYPTAEKIQGVLVSKDAHSAFEPAEAVIDFSIREACIANAIKAAEMGKNLVIGTTGLTQQEVEKIRGAIAKNKTSGVISGNFSVGVNAFIETAKFLQEKLQKYDLEMVDVHHNQKRDLPSGTALRTLDAMGKTQKEVPIHSLRIGETVGDHTLIWGGNSERIELTHRATSRRCFAQGALLSVKWIAGKKDGTLHDFREVLK